MNLVSTSLYYPQNKKPLKSSKKWVTSQVLPSIRKFGYYKLFKTENETREKQRVLNDGKKYYKHPVFSNYAASKNGDILSLKIKLKEF